MLSPRNTTRLPASASASCAASGAVSAEPRATASANRIMSCLPVNPPAARDRFKDWTVLRIGCRFGAGLRLQPGGVHGAHAVGVLLGGVCLRVGELHRHQRLRRRVAVLQVLEDRAPERVLPLL